MMSLPYGTARRLLLGFMVSLSLAAAVYADSPSRNVTTSLFTKLNTSEGCKALSSLVKTGVPDDLIDAATLRQSYQNDFFAPWDAEAVNTALQSKTREDIIEDIMKILGDEKTPHFFGDGREVTDVERHDFRERLQAYLALVENFDQGQQLVTVRETNVRFTPLREVITNRLDGEKAAGNVATDDKNTQDLLEPGTPLFLAGIYDSQRAEDEPVLLVWSQLSGFKFIESENTVAVADGDFVKEFKGLQSVVSIQTIKYSLPEGQTGKLSAPAIIRQRQEQGGEASVRAAGGDRQQEVKIGVLSLFLPIATVKHLATVKHFDSGQQSIDSFPLSLEKAQFNRVLSQCSSNPRAHDGNMPFQWGASNYNAGERLVSMDASKFLQRVYQPFGALLPSSTKAVMTWCDERCYKQPLAMGEEETFVALKSAKRGDIHIFPGGGRVIRGTITVTQLKEIDPSFFETLKTLLQKQLPASQYAAVVDKINTLELKQDGSEQLVVTTSVELGMRLEGSNPEGDDHWLLTTGSPNKVVYPGIPVLNRWLNRENAAIINPLRKKSAE